MSTPHQLWQGRVHAQITRVRDWTWTHSGDWDRLAAEQPVLYGELRRLLDVFADPPEPTRIRP